MYTPDEKPRRFKIFRENLDKIRGNNANNGSFKMGVNQFADMTQDEFRKKMLSPVPPIPPMAAGTGADVQKKMQAGVALA